MTVRNTTNRTKKGQTPTTCADNQPGVRGERATTNNCLLLSIFTSMASHPYRLVFHRLTSPSTFTPTGSSRCLLKTSSLASPTRLPAKRTESCPNLNCIVGPYRQRSTERTRRTRRSSKQAKNGLVNYCFMLRFTLKEDCSRHVCGAGKEELEKAGRDLLDWLDEN